MLKTNDGQVLLGLFDDLSDLVRVRGDGPGAVGLILINSGRENRFALLTVNTFAA